MSSRFVDVELLPFSELSALSEEFFQDDFQRKINLYSHGYCDETGKRIILSVVREAEKQLTSDESLTKDLLPTLGLGGLRKAAIKILLGEDSPALLNNRAFGAQSLSSTGALRIGAQFLAKVLGYKTFYNSNPSWPNHSVIFLQAGFEKECEYRYLMENKMGIDIHGLIEDLENAPENSVIILQACGHFPTGFDPTKDEWRAIANVIEENKLFPFFECNCQGLVSGNLNCDAWAVRHFVAKGLELFCAQSFAKNLGLANESIGNLCVVVRNSEAITPMKTQLKSIIAGMYLSPPCHGARIVTCIKNNLGFYYQWIENLNVIAERMIEMRYMLRDGLEIARTPGNWEHITEQRGLFSYTNIKAKHVYHLIEKYHIYMPVDGRINICALTEDNVHYVVGAIAETIKNVK